MKNIKSLSLLLMAIVLVNCSDDSDPELPLSDF